MLCYTATYAQDYAGLIEHITSSIRPAYIVCIDSLHHSHATVHTLKIELPMSSESKGKIYFLCQRIQADRNVTVEKSYLSAAEQYATLELSSHLHRRSAS